MNLRVLTRTMLLRPFSIVCLPLDRPHVWEGLLIIAATD